MALAEVKKVRAMELLVSYGGGLLLAGLIVFLTTLAAAGIAPKEELDELLKREEEGL